MKKKRHNFNSYASSNVVREMLPYSNIIELMATLQLCNTTDVGDIAKAQMG